MTAGRRSGGGVCPLVKSVHIGQFGKWSCLRHKEAAFCLSVQPDSERQEHLCVWLCISLGAWSLPKVLLCTFIILNSKRWTFQMLETCWSKEVLRCSLTFHRPHSDFWVSLPNIVDMQMFGQWVNALLPTVWPCLSVTTSRLSSSGSFFTLSPHYQPQKLSGRQTAAHRFVG